MGLLKDHFFIFWVLLPGRQKYFREYLRKNENIFENILENILACESRGQVPLIHLKKFFFVTFFS
jgi:hypothetical protein